MLLPSKRITVRMTSYYKLTSLNFFKVLFQLFYYLYCVLLCEDCHIIVSYIQFAGRKIHAGTRHYAVLPLSFAVKPLKYAESARHDLLPCPDCQNLSK